MKRRKRKRFNLAVFLMIVATICLSTIQVGFSFFSENLIIGGTATISPTIDSPTGIPSLDKVLNSNKENINQNITGSDAEGSGYSSIIQAANGSSLNNYVIFSDSETATKWRIIGWTDWGMKIVRNEALSDATTVWDSGTAHYVPLSSNQSFPLEQGVTSLGNVSNICNYLNGSYYTDYIANTASPDYIPSNYINYEGVWDITPMNVSSHKPFYIAGMSAGSITCKGVPSESFLGLPVGLLTVAERCMASSNYDPNADANSNAKYQALLTGWLATTSGIEITLTERLQTSNLTTSNFSTAQALFTQSSKVYNASKKSKGRLFRPTLYINSSVTLGTLSTGTGENGSITNPFLVTGLA